MLQQVFSRHLSVRQVGILKWENGNPIQIKKGTCAVCGLPIDPEYDCAIAIGSRCENCKKSGRQVFIPNENIKLLMTMPTRLTLPRLFFSDIIVDILVDNVWHRAQCPSGDSICFVEALGNHRFPLFAAIGAWELTDMIIKEQFNQTN